MLPATAPERDGIPFVLCADDFGRNAHACRAVLELAELAAISATSVLVDAPASHRYARALSAHPLALGLHLDLTERWPGAPRPRRSLPGWLAACYTHRPPPAAVLRAEIARQLDTFTAVLGRAPDFVDGHEHVHQLPGIRECLLGELQARFGQTVAVRRTLPRVWRGARAAIIARLGGRALSRALHAAGMTGNSDFAGAYSLGRATTAYPQRMYRWLKSLAPMGLVMCHPEAPGPGASPVRVAEFAFLASPAWPGLRQQLRRQLVPFRAPREMGDDPLRGAVRGPTP